MTGRIVCEERLRLDPGQWMTRADDYRRRVEQFLSPYLTRSGDPVWDFLFTYYSLRPGQLRCWHPGYGVVLAGDEAVRRYRGRRGYTARRDGVTVSDAYLCSRLYTIGFVARLLRATAQRPARLNCFGLHEWAMVYRSTAVRHDGVPLRLTPSATDAVVESMPLRCSHFDAFRFFTVDAVARNDGVPSRATQPDWEQPGCLHTNMDLYNYSAHMFPAASR